LHSTVLAAGDDRHHLVGMTFLDQLTSDEVLDAAYE
jgi:predicted aspartyl protease